MDASDMPQVNAEFGSMPVITFPSPEAPAGLRGLEIAEGDGPVVRKGDRVTVNYHGVVWGKDTPVDSSFSRHQPASFGIGIGQVIRSCSLLISVLRPGKVLSGTTAIPRPRGGSQDLAVKACEPDAVFARSMAI